MSISKIVWNMTINTTGTVVNMVSGLIVMPYLIRTLGSGTYGLWILIGTMAGYFGVLDLGVSTALGRLVAAHRARDEHDQVNEVMSTGCALLLIAFFIVCIATALSLSIFPRIFSVPSNQLLDVRYALILVGLNLALTFPGFTFVGFLWGHERFDLENAVRIPSLVIRTILSITALNASMPLTSLGVIVFGTNTIGNLARMVMCFKMDSNLRLSWHLVRKNRVREIFSLGGWMSVISWSRLLIPQIGPTLIGMRIGSAAVTTFSVAKQLVAFANMFATTATQVLAPRAIAAHARESVDEQTVLFIEGGKFAYALSLFFCGGLLCLGLPFIHWWQHGSQDGAYPLLVILVLGECFPMSQWLTYSVLLGANRQRTLGLLSVLEAVILLPIMLALIGGTDLFGVAVAVAFAAFLVRGLVQWLYGCRLLKVPLLSYCKRVFAPVTLFAITPIAALYVVTARVSPDTFLGTFVLGGAYCAVYVAVMSVTLIGPSRLMTLVIRVTAGARNRLTG
jgi:O-antigen/teichoic acid export membrane protein